jgi:hypothetical protein
LKERNIQKALRDPELKKRVLSLAPVDEDGVWKDGVLLLENASQKLLAAFDRIIHRDGAQFGMKFFVDYAERKIWVVEIPKTFRHNEAIALFHNAFRVAVPDAADLVSAPLDLTFRGTDNKDREPDACWRSGHFDTPPYAVLECGASQPITGPKGLYGKRDIWFAYYPSVHYVIIMHLSPKGRCAWIEVWQRAAAGGAALLAPTTPSAAAIAAAAPHPAALPAGTGFATNAPVTTSVGPGAGAVVGRIHFDRAALGLPALIPGAPPPAVPAAPHFELRLPIAPVFCPALPAHLPPGVLSSCNVNLTQLFCQCWP